MKIGIFGGSFNPPHKEHINLALELIEKKYVEKIIFVPTGDKYSYKNNLVNSTNRFEMLQIAVNRYPFFQVSDFELQKEVVYTYQTLDYFKQKYINDEIYFICGTDNLAYMDKWEKGEYILSTMKILILKRKGDDIAFLKNKYKKFEKNIIYTDTKYHNLSSTIIRKKLSKGLDVSNLINKEVLDYIKAKRLYEIEE